MADAAQYLATRLQHDIGGVLFQILSEGVVGGEEEPAIEALLDGRETGDVGLREGVEHVMHRIRPAGFVAKAN